jgi:hypothetical protein
MSEFYRYQQKMKEKFEFNIPAVERNLATQCRRKICRETSDLLLLCDRCLAVELNNMSTKEDF